MKEIMHSDVLYCGDLSAASDYAVFQGYCDVVARMNATLVVVV